MSVAELGNLILKIAGAITTVSAAVLLVAKIVAKPFKKINEKLDKLCEESQRSDKEIKDAIASIDEQIATIQHEELIEGYVEYGLKHNPITLQKRSSLVQMYDQYTRQNKHNHIPTDYKTVIGSAPLEGMKNEQEQNKVCSVQ